MIELLTADTPNGWKISIALEEMNLPYVFRHIKLAEGEQKEPWYLALNPNGRIPTLIDHDARDFAVFESGAIQANVFFRYAPEKIPYAIERYQREVRRLFEVLDRRLADHTYLAGDYSIADIATWSWVQGHDWSGVSLSGLAHLERWHDAIAARPAVQRGKAVPPATGPSEQRIEGARKLLV